MATMVVEPIELLDHDLLSPTRRGCDVQRIAPRTGSPPRADVADGEFRKRCGVDKIRFALAAQTEEHVIGGRDRFLHEFFAEFDRNPTKCKLRLLLNVR